MDHELLQKMAKFLWVHVDKTGPCWLWTGRKCSDGYVEFWFTGKDRIKAHRASWILANGAIPEGLCVLHKCDIRHCVNPAHLFLGTKADNSIDMVNKGRQVRGENHPRAKLTEPQVIELRQRVAAGVSKRQAGRDFGISDMAVRKIISGKSWTHIDAAKGAK